MANEESLDQVELKNEPQQEETTQQVEESQESINKKEEDTSTENFKRLRDNNERIERERDEAFALVREMKQRENITRKQEEAADEDFTLNPDDLAEGKHLTKIQKKIKRLEDKVKIYQSQSEQFSIESKIKSQYTDFDSVVTTDTIKILRDKYPELAETINSSNNLYNKAITAYTVIKNLNIAGVNKSNINNNVAQNNINKPRAAVSLSPQHGDSPLSQANAFSSGLTDTLKKQLCREMDESRKKY